MDFQMDVTCAQPCKTSQFCRRVHDDSTTQGTALTGTMHTSVVPSSCPLPEGFGDILFYYLKSWLWPDLIFRLMKDSFQAGITFYCLNSWKQRMGNQQRSKLRGLYIQSKNHIGALHIERNQMSWFVFSHINPDAGVTTWDLLLRWSGKV